MTESKDLLLEYRQEGRKTWAIRFYKDGRVKEFSDSSMAFENDEIVTRLVPLAWREIARLSSAELTKFTTALRQAGLFSLPAQLGAIGRVKDGTQSTWIVNLDGQEKTVLAVEPEASEHPALKSLREMIQEITADAFDRDAGEGKA